MNEEITDNKETTPKIEKKRSHIHQNPEEIQSKKTENKAHRREVNQRPLTPQSKSKKVENIKETSL